MSEIADFLRARYAERRAIAEAAARTSASDWHPGDEHGNYSISEAESGATVVIGPWEYLDWDLRRHIATHDPTDVLADLDAKLALIDLCMTFLHEHEGGTDPCAEGALCLLAQPFAGHPDHKGEEWAP